jgi:peptide chain release factor 1
MKVLRSRMLDMQTTEQQTRISEERKSMVKSGDRSEKIRTYNFPQARVTDHRIGLTLYRLDQVMQGDLDMLLDPISAHYQAEALKGESWPSGNGPSRNS